MPFRVKTIGLSLCLLILALPLINGCSKSIAATTTSNSSAPSSQPLTTQEPQIDVTAIMIMTPTTTVTSITTSSTPNLTTSTLPPSIIPTSVTPPNPQTFQRPAMDVYVKIEATLTLYDPALTPTAAGLNFIPYGSTIIHWQNGITEAFGPDGKRLFIARDSDAAQLPHPSGPNGPFTSPATQILQVPNGAVIGASSGSPDSFYSVSVNGAVILFVFNSRSSYPSS